METRVRFSLAPPFFLEVWLSGLRQVFAKDPRSKTSEGSNPSSSATSFYSLLVRLDSHEHHGGRTGELIKVLVLLDQFSIWWLITGEENKQRFVPRM